MAFIYDRRARPARGASAPAVAPADWANTSVCYRPDMYPDGVEESWTMILDPAHKGRITVNADTDNLVGVALAIGINSYTMTDEQLETVKRAMIQQRERVRFYWENPTDMMATAMFSIEGPPGMRDKWRLAIEEVTLGM